MTAAVNAGVGCVSWRATSAQALERRAKALDDAGLGLGWSNGDFGRGRSYRFRDPDGHVMEIYYEEQKFVAPASLHSTLKNLPQKYTGRGVCVRRVDHLALLAKDVEANRKFAQELLGFQLREQVRYDKGKTEIGSWMSPTAIHHQLAYVVDVKGAHGRLHHFSLWVDNRDDVLRAADILSENGIFLEAGPSKHNNSQGFYLYTYEPGGNRVEIYTGSFLVMAPDWEPVTWDEEERGTGTYWGPRCRTASSNTPRPMWKARVPARRRNFRCSSNAQSKINVAMPLPRRIYSRAVSLAERESNKRESATRESELGITRV